MKKKFRLLAVLASVLLVLGVSASFAQEGTLSEQDRTFVKEAASGGMLEVRLGEIASKQASNEEVRNFGQRMVADHSKANDELKEIAGKKNVEVPQEMKEEHKEAVERLSKLSGEEFDREYMSFMVKDHQEDVEKFRTQAEEGQDPELKAFASKTVKVLEEHLEQAKQLNEKVGGATQS